MFCTVLQRVNNSKVVLSERGQNSKILPGEALIFCAYKKHNRTKILPENELNITKKF